MKWIPRQSRRGRWMDVVGRVGFVNAPIGLRIQPEAERPLLAGRSGVRETPVMTCNTGRQQLAEDARDLSFRVACAESGVVYSTAALFFTSIGIAGFYVTLKFGSILA